jgi:hypothetical protein
MRDQTRPSLTKRESPKLQIDSIAMEKALEAISSIVALRACLSAASAPMISRRQYELSETT